MSRQDASPVSTTSKLNKMLMAADDMDALPKQHPSRRMGKHTIGNVLITPIWLCMSDSLLIRALKSRKTKLVVQSEILHVAADSLP